MVKSDPGFPAAFLLLTEKLLVAAQARDWQALAKCSAERDALIQDQHFGPWLAEERRMLERAQQMNEQLMAITSLRMDDLRSQLRPFQVRSRLLGRYG